MTFQSHRHPESTWQNGCLRPQGSLRHCLTHARYIERACLFSLKFHHLMLIFSYFSYHMFYAAYGCWHGSTAVPIPVWFPPMLHPFLPLIPWHDRGNPKSHIWSLPDQGSLQQWQFPYTPRRPFLISYQFPCQKDSWYRNLLLDCSCGLQ